MRAVCLAVVLALPAVGRAQTLEAGADDTHEDARLLPVLAAEEESAPLFGPRYVIERIDVIGNHKTETSLILREVGLAVGDVVAATDPRVDTARLRLLSLGLFLDVQFSLAKGTRRGAAVLAVTVEERGTIILNAIYLGTSEATTWWGGLDLAETNFLGRGIGVGGGFVLSTRPEVPGAQAARALSLRAAGPLRRNGVPSPYGSFLYSDGSEFFRAFGAPDESHPESFVAVRTRRAGGTLGVGMDVSRATRVTAEGHYESIDASLPAVRTQQNADGTLRPLVFGIHEGRSRLSSLAVGFDVDTRSDPVLPTRGGRASVSLQTALPLLGSRYAFAKGMVQASYYRPVRSHVLGIHGFAGAIFGDAPYFEQFFVGDLNQLLPPRALGINFSTLASRDFLGTSVAGHRYEPFAARLLVEYAVPLWRRRKLVYRGDAFAAFGAFALGSIDDLRQRDVSFGRAIPADLTADLGLRLDTYVGIFTFSIGNLIGRIPF
jgi:outer membrane protein insertion porin family